MMRFRYHDGLGLPHLRIRARGTPAAFDCMKQGRRSREGGISYEENRSFFHQQRPNYKAIASHSAVPEILSGAAFEGSALAKPLLRTHHAGGRESRHTDPYDQNISPSTGYIIAKLHFATFTRVGGGRSRLQGTIAFKLYAETSRQARFFILEAIILKSTPKRRRAQVQSVLKSQFKKLERRRGQSNGSSAITA